MSEVVENKEKKERKPRKGKKSNKSKLNKVNNEQVTTVLPDKEIKHDIINIEFDTFTFGAGDSEYVTEQFGNKTRILDNLTIEFFYNEKLDLNDQNVNLMRSNLFVSNMFLNLSRSNVNNYIKNLKKKLREALNIPKVVKGLRTAIAYLDGVNDPNVMKTLPRYLRLKRLESGYERVICIGLSLIHQYYWVDITNNETSVDFSLKDAIIRASPTIIKLKHDVEDYVRTEFSYSAEEEHLILTNRKY